MALSFLPQGNSFSSLGKQAPSRAAPWPASGCGEGGGLETGSWAGRGSGTCFQGRAAAGSQGEETHFSVLIFFPRLGTGLTSKVDRARTFIRTNYIM